MTVHSDARSWDDLWEMVKAGPSGGQATSNIARRRDGGVELGFVKMLTKQDDTEAARPLLSRGSHFGEPCH